MNKINFPQIVSVNMPFKMDDPFSHNSVKEHQKRQYKGYVTADGTFKIQPAAGWSVKRNKTGVYTIQHDLGNTNYSVNISPDGRSAIFNITNICDKYLNVEITDNKSEHINCDFMFCISVTIDIPVSG